MPLKHQSRTCGTKSHKNKYVPIPQDTENIGKKIVHSACLVHKALVCGLLGKVYKICLCHEIRKMGLIVVRQMDIPII